jgi:hypothetical protein
MDDFDEVDELFRDDEDDDVVPEKVLLNGATDVGTLLLRYFLSAAIADNNGVLNISRKALAEIAAKCDAHKSFEIWTSGDFNDDGIELTLNWVD